MIVHIPSQLYSYTQSKQVEATGDTLNELLLDLDRQYPGLRFRIVDEQNQVRAHILLVLNRQSVRDLAAPLAGMDSLRIIGALSGG
jgi:molybdopterin converting factor small subunit